MSKPFKRILFTGTGGNLDRRLRKRLHDFADVVRLADVADIGLAGANEEVVQCDLADRAQVMRMCDSVDAELHFGAIHPGWRPAVRLSGGGRPEHLPAGRRVRDHRPEISAIRRR
ncbi:hypothetical protein [Massilia timonae]|uniref:Putative nAD-dependent epimerase/dehydratase n=1 Tax=Massilia timonae TaxID=47229 RepID=A0A1S2NG87_9BURK|nr:hypothetical protein [Massilia timonae]OIJ44107.1 putative nAD-dependent epimerase/dehydratase [Massilia timonae]